MNRCCRSLSLLIISSVLFTCAGCDMLFGNKSRISVEKVCQAFEEYDAEEYGDISELAGDLDNERSLLAGMFISAEGKDTKHILKDNDINTFAEETSEISVSDMYSKSADRIAFLIQSETLEEDMKTMVVACVYDFGSEDDAYSFYNSCNDNYGDLAEETENSTKLLDYFAEDSLECTVTIIQARKYVTAYCVYIDGRSVLVIAGYEYRCNELDDRLGDLCDAADIPAPSIETYDFPSDSDPGYDPAMDRFMDAVEYYDATLVDEDSFDSSSYTGGAVYCIVTDGTRDTGSGFGSIGQYSDLVTEQKILLSSLGGSSYEFVMVTCYVTGSEDDALTIYESMSSSFDRIGSVYGGGQSFQVDSGDVDGILYSKLSLMGMMNYAIYCDHDRVYVLTGMGSGLAGITDAMSLP